MINLVELAAVFLVATLASTAFAAIAMSAPRIVNSQTPLQKNLKTPEGNSRD